MINRLKLGLVGAGPVAERYYVPAIRAVPEVEAWMVADLDRARSQRIAELVPFKHAVTSVDDLLGNVDLAIVALPNGLHQPLTCQLLEAGIHVLCEKPMARTVSECMEMIAAAEKSGSLLCIGHNRRFRTNVIEAKKLIGRGMIGQITRVEAEEGSDADWPRSRAYFDPAVAGGGALLDVGIHSIDLIRYLVADFAGVEYAGNQTADTVESHGELRFTLENGATGTLTCSREQNLQQQIVLHGTKGELTIGLWSPDLILVCKSGKAFEHYKQLRLNPVRRASDASFVEQLYRLVRSIVHGGLIPVSGSEGLKAVEVVEWAYGGMRPAIAATNRCSMDAMPGKETAPGMERQI